MFNQKGAAHLLILLAAIGLVAFLIIASTVSFKDKMFAGLFPKKESHAFENLDWDESETLIREGDIEPAKKILEVRVAYKKDSKPIFQIKKIQKKNSHVVQDLINGESYQIVVEDGSSEELYRAPFALPNKPFVDDFSQDSEKKGQIELDEVNFVVSVPFFSNAVRVAIFDSNNNLITSSDLKKVENMNNAPKFRSIRGDEFLKAKKNGRVEVPNLVDEAKAGGENYVDIVMVGNDYDGTPGNTAQDFVDDVSDFISLFLSYEPFASKADKFVFHTIDNSTDFKCLNDEDILYCDQSMVVSKVNDSGVPYDRIYVIENTPNDRYFRGSSYGLVAQGSNDEDGEEIFVHEMGHSIGSLEDEYIYYYDDEGYLDNSTFINCYKGSEPPSPAWSGLVNSDEYFQGCIYPNWYRSSECSVMLDHVNCPYFNKVSIRALNKAIDYWTGVLANELTIIPNCSSPHSDNAIGTNVSHMDVALYGYFTKINPDDSLWMVVKDTKSGQEATENFGWVSGYLGYTVHDEFYQGLEPYNSLKFVPDGRTYTVKVYSDPFNEGNYPNLNHLLLEKSFNLVCPWATPLPSVSPTPSSSPTSTMFIPGDINRNHRVDVFDFNLLITDFGKTDTVSRRSDVNKNGRVDIFDFNILITNFGKSN